MIESYDARLLMIDLFCDSTARDENGGSQFQPIIVLSPRVIDIDDVLIKSDVCVALRMR